MTGCGSVSVAGACTGTGVNGFAVVGVVGVRVDRERVGVYWGSPVAGRGYACGVWVVLGYLLVAALAWALGLGLGPSLVGVRW